MSDCLEREPEEVHMVPSEQPEWEGEDGDLSDSLEWEGEEISLISDLQKTASTAARHRFPPVELETRMIGSHVIYCPTANGSREGTPPLLSVAQSEPDGARSLSCRRGKSAPDRMRRGAAVVCANTAYFNSSNSSVS